MGRLFGSHGHILLHSMGGLAIGSADVSYRWQRILVSLAGPGIQLLLAGVLIGLAYAGLITDELRANPAFGRMWGMLLWINVGWAILNLIPVWPLDGGWVSREVCQAVSSRSGLVVSLWISVIVGAVLAINALVVELQVRETLPLPLVEGFPGAGLIPYIGGYFGGFYLAILFGLLAAGSWQALQQETQRHRRMWDDDLPWER
jgi:Zn-dependent protease